MKTYATTPRSELEDMAPAVLVSHLKKCERERTHLRKSRDQQIAESEVQDSDMDEQVAQRQMMLDALKNRTSKGRAEEKAKHQDLLHETDDLEKERAELKAEYDAEFTSWYHMTQDMAGKLERVSACPAAASQETVLVARRQNRTRAPAVRQLTLDKRPVLALVRRAIRSGYTARLTPEEERMYSRMDKIGDCEDNNIDLNDEIEEAETRTRQKTVKATDTIKRLSSAMDAQEKFAKVMSKTKQVAATARVTETLDDAVEKLEARLEEYRVKNAELHLNLQDLDAELVEFGC